MKDDVLEEWHRLADRIAKAPQYDFGKWQPKWGQPYQWEAPKEQVRLFATDSADGKPAQAISAFRNSLTTRSRFS